MPHKTLILTGRSIQKLISMRQVLTIVEAAFKVQGRGAIQMPAKIYLHLNKYRGDFRAMPAYIEGLEACGVKWVNVHPDNLRRGLPAVMALFILSDPRTGFPLAVMDATHITNFRTGAAGGIAAKYLANKNSSRIGFVGCGVQAFYQLLALNQLFKIRTVSAVDINAVQTAKFIKTAKSIGVVVSRSASRADCVRDKDIVVTTTPSRTPVVRSSWISEGTHINAIGADAQGKEELEPALLKRSRIIVDDLTQAAHSGEINVPLSKGIIRPSNICATLADIVTRRKRGRRSAGDITVFDSTGLAILDVAVASYIYRKALRSRKSGLAIDLIS